MSDEPWDGADDPLAASSDEDSSSEPNDDDQLQESIDDDWVGGEPVATAGVEDGSGPADGSMENRTPEAGIGSSVAPWESGRGSGGVGRAFLEVVVTVVLSFALALAVVFAGFVALLIVVSGEPSTVQTLVISLLGSQIGLATGALGYLRWRDEPLGNIGIAVPGFKSIVLVVVGTFTTLVLAYVVAFLVQVLGVPAAENATAGEAREVPSSLLLLIPIAIFVIGPCEELLFRGVVQRRLREVASAPVAIVVASALFAGAHVVALVGDLAAVATTVGILFVPALVFGILYEYTKNVAVTALVHGLYDAVLFGLLYVALRYGPENPQGTQSTVIAVLEPVLALI